MTGSSPSSAKKRNLWLAAAAAFLALFGPILYAFGPEGAGRPREYIPVGIMFGALFSDIGPVVVAWYGTQYLVYAVLVFVALKLVERAAVRRRSAQSNIRKRMVP